MAIDLRTLLSFLFGAVCIALYPTTGGSREVLLTPDVLSMEGEPALEVERGLLFVPENRADPASRTIAVHFLRFRSLVPASSGRESRRPPVFLMPGGPGSEYDFSDRWDREALKHLRKTRDVVYISQRGNPRAPGLVPALTMFGARLPLDQPNSTRFGRDTQRAALKASIEEWTRRGVDLRGYDIMNVVDDVHDLRAALGYDKVVLRGCSFGSQWGLAYMKRWPETVDRALLSGVEPLDYTFDDPKAVWASIVRLAQQAEADSTFSKHVPSSGLIAALQRTMRRLETQPVKVRIEEPRTNRPIDVVVGADDLRELVRNPNAFASGSRLQSLANWPRFIVEVAAGDYRYLAAKTAELRMQTRSRPLIGLLIDNSLDITAARDASLVAAPEARWLGDINQDYRDTRALTPTGRVGDDFRADWPIDVPVLLINGDLDWSTPIESARHLLGFLKEGHLVEIGGGTHCTELSEVMAQQPASMRRLYSFIDADFTATPPRKFFGSLPSRLALAPLRFQEPTGNPSLYEQWRLNARENRQRR